MTVPILMRWGISLIFVYSGVVKLTAPQAFADVISDFGIVYESTVFPLAVGLSVLEVMVGLGLIINLRGSLAVVTALLCLFSAVLAYGIWLGLDIDCGCFGLGDPRWRQGTLAMALLRDGVLLVVCGYLYASRRATGKKPVRIGKVLARIQGKRRK